MKRIVIVEDNSKIREGFAAVIESSGKYYLAGSYSNCEDAVRNLEKNKPDVILMDIELPGMSGIEGTLKIRKQCPECIILIITVFEDSEKVFQSLCAGATGYLVKNSNLDDIIKSIDEALSGGAPMSLHIARMVVQSFKQSNNSPLSERETEVLQGIAEGKSYSKIAVDLFISKETVRSHIKKIYQKLEVNSKSAALLVAGNNKWLNKPKF
ncbi:MAG: response regulator transcription factor [Candidatus Pseudobacter hemicellulosilyticus]|uniref:Response regulator transcription factor n=1 Tax=Candidatus Pseudobacter hemicellulosilyticus TaxID=3121375 RepID=A0AAJ6BJE1_9BACT|nr:MAG: response regulator transcription factor [Pseudobacter sp.]